MGHAEPKHREGELHPHRVVPLHAGWSHPPLRRSQATGPRYPVSVSRSLPGSQGNNSKGRALALAALHCIGLSHLVEAGREFQTDRSGSLDILVPKATQLLSSISGGQEFRALSKGDKDWVETQLISAYEYLNTQAPREIALQALTSAEDLARTVITRGMKDHGKLALEAADENVWSYFRQLNLSIAQLIHDWYLESPAGQRSAAAIGASAFVGWINNPQPDPTSPNPLGLLDRLYQGLSSALNATPDYYPPTFTTSELGEALRVVELVDEKFDRFASEGLYWDGYLYGSALPASSLIRSQSLTVLLGDPGSGKTTLARKLVLDALQANQSAIFARLEDLDAEFAECPNSNPLEAVVLASAKSARIALSRREAAEITKFWHDTDASPLIVLDGLDEVATAAGVQEARNTARTLVELGGTVIITSRLAGYTQPWQQVKYHFGMLPLDEDQQRAFGTRWFDLTGSENAPERFADALSQESLGAILSNPLTLGFVCMIAHHEHVPHTPAAVIDRFIDHFIRAPWKPAEQQIWDVGRVSHLRAQAISAAWSMALLKRDQTTRWADTATLAEIASQTTGENALDTYDIGLLIPHGHLEPRGDTHQSTRWLHRRIHENLVAQKLCTLIAQDDPSWKNLINNAVMLPTWREAFLQCLDLLSDHSGITVTRHLLDEAQRGDTPDADFALAAGLAARKPKKNELTKEVILQLAKERDWPTAISLDIHETLIQLTKEAPDGTYVKFEATKFSLSAHPNLLDEQEEIEKLVNLDRQYSLIDKMIQIISRGDDDACREFAEETCRVGKYTPFPEPIPPNIWTKLLAQFESLIHLPNSNGELPDPWVICQSLDSANGHQESWPQLSNSPVLNLTQDRRSGDHNYKLSDYLNRSDYLYHPGHLDLIYTIAWHLKLDGYPAEVFAPEHRIIWETECWCGRSTSPPLTHFGDLSTELAHNILKRVPNQDRWNANLIESANWSLWILRDHPSINVIPTLLRLQLSRAEIPLDSNTFTAVLNNQPWHEAAFLPFPNSPSGHFWQGFCSVIAGSISLSPLHPASHMTNSSAFDLIAKGVSLLAADTSRLRLRAVREFIYFEAIPENYRQEFISQVIAVCQQHRTRAAFIILKSLSQRIQELGLLPDYPELRDPAWTEFRRAEARVRS